MGLYKSPDIYQEKMNELCNGLDDVRTYIDDLLMIDNKSLEDHIKKLDKGLRKLKSVGFKVNTEKSFFARNDREYLGFKITREGAIKNIAIPTTKK